jgi:hypothetical protein
VAVELIERCKTIKLHFTRSRTIPEIVFLIPNKNDADGSRADWQSDRTGPPLFFISCIFIIFLIFYQILLSSVEPFSGFPI